MIRFGVLGAGRIGKVHARTIAASGKAKVAYIADAMPKAAVEVGAVQRQYGLDRMAAGILNSCNTDAVETH